MHYHSGREPGSCPAGADSARVGVMSEASRTENPAPLTARTRVAAVIGSPIDHSLSPALHNAAFAAAGIDATLIACRVASADLAAAVAGLRALNFLGASVTIPHKCQVAALCDRVEPVAEATGAVNCLVFAGDEITGHNTDALGFVDSVGDELDLDLIRRAVLLGSGGAARAVAAGLSGRGIGVTVVARSPERAVWVGARDWSAEVLAETLPDCDLLVDCSAAALTAASEDSIPARIPLARLPATAAVVSLIYHRETKLVAAARARGLQAFGGGGMLVHQAARALQLWTGHNPSIAAMRAALDRAVG